MWSEMWSEALRGSQRAWKTSVHLSLRGFLAASASPGSRGFCVHVYPRGCVTSRSSSQGVRGREFDYTQVKAISRHNSILVLRCR